MNNPQFEDLTDMVLIERNHEIKALSARATDQALTKCIRLRTPVRRSQGSQTQRSKGGIQFTGIDAVAVVNNELVAFIAHHHTLSELLRCPLGCRMACHVDMKDAPSPNLHDHQHINEPKCGRYHEKKSDAMIAVA